MFEWLVVCFFVRAFFGFYAGNCVRGFCFVLRGLCWDGVEVYCAAFVGVVRG